MARRLLVLMLLLAFGAGMVGAYVLARRSSHDAKPVSPTTTTQAHKRHVVRRVHGPHNSAVPILMYHVLGVPGANAAYPELFVKPADFAGQMHWLARNGYHGVTLRQVFRYWRQAIALPPKPIVVSFDDGYLSDYQVARPTLRKLHWPGVLNLIVHNVRPGDLTKWQVNQLLAAGWELDAHTVSHADLTTVDATRLRYEVAGSRRYLRSTFNQAVDFFCYPAGRYDAQVIAAVRAAGYLGATTVRPGLAGPSQPYTLPRIRIDYTDGVSGFAAKLTRYTR
jgi:peptidoglycan/xylan/chitin deacetylase (PgdA/CDA1 family)